MLNHPWSPNASIARHAAASFAIAALAFATPALAQADLFNEWDVPTLDPGTNTFGPTGMEFDFQGDATGCIPAQLTNVTLTNPWYAYTQWPHGGGTSGYQQATYNGTITTVIMYGPPLPVPAIAPGQGFQGPTDGNGSTSSYHVGLNTGFGSACVNNPLIKKRWIWTDPNNPNNVQYQDVPVTASKWSGLGESKQNFKKGKGAVLYVETNAPAYTGTWYWVAYVPARNGKPPSFTLTNNGPYTITLGNAGIVIGLGLPTDKKCLKTPTCPDNQEILDSLNNSGFPVNGQANSPLTPLPKLNGAAMAPGQSLTVQAP
jgi:hypothetical protein